MSEPGGLTLVLGGFGAGKTTLLVQLFGRMRSADSQLRVVSAPASLTPVREGLERLAQGRPVSHTPSGVEVIQELSAETFEGNRIDIAIPDYAGETLDAVVDNRRVPEWWRAHCTESSRWLLLIRVERMEDVPDFASADYQLTRSSETSHATLPLDMRLVELLQILWHERQRLAADTARPSLAVALSCWDEITPDASGRVPAGVLAERMPLLSAFLETNWDGAASAVFGLSAQGHKLVDNEPNEAFVDRGPERMGFLIRPDGSQTDDLTELLMP